MVKSLVGLGAVAVEVLECVPIQTKLPASYRAFVSGQVATKIHRGQAITEELAVLDSICCTRASGQQNPPRPLS